MKIIDLLKMCPYESVEKEIVYYYGDNELEAYRELYQQLQKRTIKKPLKKDLYIHITVRKINSGGTDPAVELFDDSDPDVYFDVSGVEENNDILYSIAASSCEDFLQYSIETNTLERFSYASILAHTLWEFTSYGVEDKIQR